MVVGLQVLNWQKALAITLLPAAISLMLLVVLVQPFQSEIDIANWGYRLTVVGFVVTLFGFGATIWQSFQAVGAAKAAGQSVDRLRNQLGSFDIVGAIGNAQATAIDGLAHVGASRWEASLGSFNRLQLHMSQLVSAPGYMEKEELETANDLRAKLGDACQAISKTLREGPETLDIERLEQNLRDLQHFLISLAARLRDRINV